MENLVIIDYEIISKSKKEGELRVYFDSSNGVFSKCFDVNKTSKGYSAHANSNIRRLYVAVFGNEPTTRRLGQYIKHLVGKTVDSAVLDEAMKVWRV